MQKASESVSKVYYLSDRCEKLLRVAKADLHAALGNVHDALEEYLDNIQQERTRALPSERESDSAIAEKIINLSRIAKVRIHQLTRISFKQTASSFQNHCKPMKQFTSCKRRWMHQTRL